MDIYSRKNRWKLYLAIVGLIIVLISMIYTNYLATELKNEEQKKVESYFLAQNQLTQLDNNCDITLHAKILESNTTIPVILTTDRDSVIQGVNFGTELDYDKRFLQNEVDEMKADGFRPIENSGQRIYYQNSTLLTQLQYFPIFQFILIAAFIAFGYIAFSNARRAEQNRVWVGMAKETAHQLGTPISAILGWLDHLKMIKEDDDETLEVVEELRKDVDRLDLVADRFSKIGSAPKLEPVNVYAQLEQCRAYMQRRAPRKVQFDFPNIEDFPPKTIYINQHLFDWVIENLLRNALDAMDGKGEISAVVSEDDQYVIVNVSDTGKGIPSNKFKTVFQPGFTTKKRGWGLGLSLAKRIIEEYHSGKIFVSNSVEGKGTTFSIKLPKKVKLQSK